MEGGVNVSIDQCACIWGACYTQTAICFVLFFQFPLGLAALPSPGDFDQPIVLVWGAGA
jgi:hypothetical protein